jgi:formylglycine-generating enzyme required for sulfatase activity
MSKLFISYRRDDTAEVCGRMDDRLAPRFGRANVFKDVDSIPLGSDFRAILRDKVDECAAMLVVIGRRWVEMADEHGRRRLENPGDFVRIEVEAALARGIPVIPVLVQGAAVPREDQLPASLAPLAYRHGIEVRGDPHFHRDLDQLIERLAPLLQPAAAAPAQPTIRPQPATPAGPAIARDHFPPRLEQLGFIAHKNGSIGYILPPLCSVAAGEFLMGSDPKKDSGAYDDEKPQHTVRLSGYQIARHPVTVAEYACFVRAGHKGPSDWQQQLGTLDHPVVNVSWDDATAYAAWLKQQAGQPWRLPTEAEWEKAVRWDPAARRARIYPWGDTFDAHRANTTGKGTPSVGSYPSGASAYGIQGASGTLWEWTSSLKKPLPYSPSDGRERTEPDDNRVLRGGSWDATPRNARAAYRLSGQYVYLLRDNGRYVGFRVLLAVPGS